MNNRNEFKEWLKAIPKIEGGEYEDNTIGTYIGALDELNRILRNNNLFHADIYEISDPKQAKKVLEIYDSNADVRKALKQKRHTATKTCLRRYIEFLEIKENNSMTINYSIVNAEHIKKALDYVDENGIPEHRVSVTRFIVYEGKEYPPKYVFAIAYMIATGRNEQEAKSFNEFTTNQIVPTLRKFASEIGYEIIINIDSKNLAEMTAQERKNAFKLWLSKQSSKKGGDLPADTQKVYLKALNELNNLWLQQEIFNKDIYEVSGAEEAEEILEICKSNDILRTRDSQLGNGRGKACLSHYINFLKTKNSVANEMYIIDWNDDFKAKEPYLKTKPVSLIFLNVEEKQIKDWLNLPNEIIFNLLKDGYNEEEIQKAYPFKPQFSTSEKIAESNLYKIVDLSLTCGVLRWCKGLLQTLKIDLSKVIVKYKKTKISDMVDEGEENITYWLCGASYDSGGDMTRKFIDEGVYGIEWFYESIKDAIDNYEKLDLFFDKYNVGKNGRNTFHLLLQMKEGDKIAIKSTNYKTGVFYIKAIGTVIKSAIDGYTFDPVLGHTIPVEWEQCTPFNINDRSMVATYSKTIHQISNQEHIDRIFYGADEKSVNNKYSKEAFLKEVYISGEQYDKIISALVRKKNIILQGAPGVGKSFLAQRLAYSIMGKKDKDKVAMIQFHQSYSYEDFVMGYKPNSDGGFELKNGVFYEFCERAKARPNEKFYFIIDEINRGNLSKILGEIMLLVESDKRGKFENEEWECAFSLKTTYGNNDEKFFIPDNVYIIGLMNTADRSLALLDYALRRRFSFVDISPAFENGEFISYIESCKEKDSIEKVLKAIKEINQAIESDSSLGKGFRIGHSYFCNLIDIDLSELEQIVLFEIFPLIEEYWIENESEVKKHKDKLTAALNG